MLRNERQNCIGGHGLEECLRVFVIHYLFKKEKIYEEKRFK
jgi:hypothetical protein